MGGPESIRHLVFGQMPPKSVTARRSGRLFGRNPGVERHGIVGITAAACASVFAYHPVRRCVDEQRDLNAS